MAAGHSPLGFGSDSVIYPELSYIAPTSPEPGSAHHRAASCSPHTGHMGSLGGGEGRGAGGRDQLGDQGEAAGGAAQSPGRRKGMRQDWLTHSEPKLSLCFTVRETEAQRDGIPCLPVTAVGSGAGIKPGLLRSKDRRPKGMGK